MDRPESAAVKQCDLSVVLPCFRAAEVAQRSVERLWRSLKDTICGDFEIIVVDDGGGDFPEAPWNEGRARLLHLPANRGKGAAVSAGMKAASGRARIFTDVDLPYGVEVIPLIAAYLLEGPFHVVIGDRTLKSSTYMREIDWRRRLASRVFSTFVGRVVTGGFFDTQCGLKGFRGDVAEHLFELVTVKRFTFDVELVYISLLHRLDIKRIPVQLEANETSSVRLLSDSARGFVDVFRIKLNQIGGAYDSPGLDDLALGDFVGFRDSALARLR